MHPFNSAAEAVIKGQTDSILLFHRQNVPRTKLEQVRRLQRELNRRKVCKRKPFVFSEVHVGFVCVGGVFVYLF